MRGFHPALWRCSMPGELSPRVAWCAAAVDCSGCTNAHSRALMSKLCHRQMCMFSDTSAGGLQLKCCRWDILSHLCTETALSEVCHPSAVHLHTDAVNGMQLVPLAASSPCNDVSSSGLLCMGLMPKYNCGQVTWSYSCRFAILLMQVDPDAEAVEAERSNKRSGAAGLLCSGPSAAGASPLDF